MSDHTVFKYTLDFGIGRKTVNEIELPEGAKVLHVAEQRGAIQLWAWVNPEAPKVKRAFAICGTGMPTPPPDEATHLGSVIAGAFVWHIFERTP